MQLSCGVIVTDGVRLLLGHATGSARWDIPKGLCEAGETEEAAARRELAEETGLVAPAGALVSLGRRPYRPGKDLAPFVWRVDALPEPGGLACRSCFVDRRGRLVPELDRFGLFAPEAAAVLVAKGLRPVLAEVFAR